MSKNAHKHTPDDTRVHNAPVTHVDVPRSRPILKATEEQRQYVDKYKVNGIEVGAVLLAFGSSQREFARFVNKSASLVNKWIGRKYRTIPFRFAVKLQEFVGEELYITTLENLRTKRIKREAQDVESTG